MDNHITGILLALAGLTGVIYACISFLKNREKTSNIKLILYSGVIGAVIFMIGLGLVIFTTDEEIIFTPYGQLKQKQITDPLI